VVGLIHYNHHNRSLMFQTVKYWQIKTISLLLASLLPEWPVWFLKVS
jgi:hypothetical protein